MPKKPPESQESPYLVRKLDERDETVTVKLTDAQIAAKEKEACTLRDQVDKMDDEFKSSSAEFKAKRKAKLHLEECARVAASTGKIEVDLHIEEWLTRTNEVVRIDAETGDLIGPPRTARASELQEVLFPADAPKKKAETGAKDDFPVGNAFEGT